MSDEHDKSLEEKLDERARAERVTIVCPSCHHEDTIVFDSAVNGAPESLVVQIARLFRHEIRHAALSAPPSTAPLPPFDIAAERALCASVLLGIRWPQANDLRRSHFFSPLYGVVWDLALEAQGKIDVGTIASRMEGERICDRVTAAKVLLELQSPHVAAACNPEIVARVRALAWQRELFFRAGALEASFLGKHLDKTVARSHLLELLALLEAGPEGDPVLSRIEAAITVSGGDQSSFARQERAEKYSRHRDLALSMASSVLAFLAKENVSDETALDRIARVIERLDKTRGALYDIWQKLSGGAP